MIIGVFVAIFAGIIQMLDAGPKYEVLSHLLYPLFRFGWAFGIMPKIMLKKIDDTSFHLLGDASSKDEILSWKIDAGDVVVATFAKSGTHLSLQTVVQIMSGASEATGDGLQTIHHAVACPEIVTAKAVAKCEDKKIMHAGNLHGRSATGDVAIWGTHLDYHHTPSRKDAKYLIMARDPVDVILSLQSMISKILGRVGPRKHELLPMLETASGGWAEFNLEWWKHRHDANVMFVFYEDAVKDPKAMVANFTKFLGKPDDPDIAARVLERSSVAYMKARHKVFDPPTCMEMDMPLQKPKNTKESMMVNKGKAGRGAKEIDDATRQRIREYCQRVFKGSDFPIEKWPGCN